MGESQDIEDAILIERFKANDESAFNALYSRYRLPLFAYIHKLLPNTCNSTIDDYFQQVWIKVVANIGNYNEQQRFYAWLCRIARNMIIDSFRRNAGRTYVELDEGLKYEGETELLSERLERERSYVELERLIQELPEAQREVVEGRRKGLSFKEIAQQQQTNMNTVLGRMHYAVVKLKEKIQSSIKNGGNDELQ